MPFGFENGTVNLHKMPCLLACLFTAVLPKCIDSNGPKETQNPPCASRKKSAEKVVLHHRPYTVPWTAYASHTPYYPDYPAWVWCGFMAALEPTKETEGMPVQSFHIHPF